MIERKGARKEVREKSRVAGDRSSSSSSSSSSNSACSAYRVLNDMFYKFGIRDDFSSNRVRRTGGFSIASGNCAYFTV